MLAKALSISQWAISAISRKEHSKLSWENMLRPFSAMYASSILYCPSWRCRKPVGPSLYRKEEEALFKCCNSMFSSSIRTRFMRLDTCPSWSMWSYRVAWPITIRFSHVPHRAHPFFCLFQSWRGPGVSQERAVNIFCASKRLHDVNIVVIWSSVLRLMLMVTMIVTILDNKEDEDEDDKDRWCCSCCCWW